MKWMKLWCVFTAALTVLHSGWVGAQEQGTAVDVEGIPLVVSAGRYQASEEFTLENNPTQNWSWDVRAFAAGFKTSLTNQVPLEKGAALALSNKLTDSFKDASYLAPEGAIADSFQLFDQSLNDSTGARIGQYWMKQGITELSAKNVYVARTFTAPKDGSVVISADYQKESKILSVAGYASNEKNQRGVRLIKSSDGAETQLWPTDENKGTAETKTFDGAEFAVVPRGTAIDFPALEETLKQNDKLYFELTNLNFELDKDGNSHTGVAVYWDPIVEYDTGIEAALTSPSHLSDLPPNQTFTVTTQPEIEEFTAENVKIVDSTGKAAQVLTAEKDGNRLTFAFDNLNFDQNYTVTLSGLSVGKTAGECVFSFSTLQMDMKTYQASEYYNQTDNPALDADGTGPWTWEYYDRKTGSYEKLENKGSRDDGGFSIVPNYGGCTMVGQYSMYADTRYSGQNGAAGSPAYYDVSDPDYPAAWNRYYAVRTFTAPESGEVTLSAAEPIVASANAATAGPRLRIILERSGQEPVQLWPEEAGAWQTVLSGKPLDFVPIGQNLLQGDKLHFELSGEHASSGGCWSMNARWDPVVRYNQLHPTVTDVSSEVGDDGRVPGNAEFVLTLNREIAPPSVDNVEIFANNPEGGEEKAPRASAVSLEQDKKTLHIQLNGDTLLENTAYTLRVFDLRLDYLADYKSSFESRIPFTTGAYTIYGGFERRGAQVILPVNNTRSVPTSVTVIAALCEGTPENYRVKSARYVTEAGVVGRKSVTVQLSEVPGSGEFVKAIAVTKPDFGKALCDMAVLK